MPAGFSVAITYGGQTETVDGVEGELVETIDLFDESTTPRSFSAAVVFKELDWPRMYARGHRPATAYGRVYYNSTLVLAGRLQQGTQWGERYDPVRFTITEEPWLRPVEYPPSYEVRYSVLNTAALAELQASTDAPLPLRVMAEQLSSRPAPLGDPSLTLTVNGQTFDAFAEKVQGRVGPIVFGAPGYQGGSTWPAVPAWFIDTGSGTEKLLVAYHPVEASSVTVYGPAGDGSGTISIVVAVTQTTDAYGRRVSIADISGDIGATSADFAADLEADWYTAWHNGEGLPGGAGDVLAHMLQQTDARVDVSRLLAVRDELNAYTLAGFISDVVDVWEWLFDTFAVLPVSWVVGDAGLWLYVHDPDGVSVARWEHGQGFAIDGDLGETTQPPARRVDLQYQHREDTGELLQLASPVTLHTRLASQLEGAEVVELRTLYIDDEGTATRAAIARQRALSAVHAEVVGVVSRSEHGRVPVGTWVTVHAPTYGVFERRALVVQRTDDGSDLLTYRCVLFADPTYAVTGSYSEAAYVARWNPLDKVGAWAFWDPYDRETGDNIFSGTWTQVADVSGNARHATLAGGTSAAVSSAVYGPDRDLALPISGDTSTVMRYKLGADSDIFKHHAGYCGPFMELGNQSEWYLHCRNVTQILLRKVRANSGSFPHNMTCGGTGGGVFSADFGSDPAVTGDPGPNDWTVYAWSADGGSPEGLAGSTETWSLVWATRRADQNDGAVVIHAKATWTTSVTLDNSVGFGVDPFGYRDAFRGLSYVAASAVIPWGRAWVFKHENPSVAELIDICAGNLEETHGLAQAAAFYEAAIAAEET